MSETDKSTFETVTLTELTPRHYPFGLGVPGIGEISFEATDVTPFAEMLIEAARALDAAGRLPPGEIQANHGKAPLVTNNPDSGANRPMPSGRQINIRHTNHQFIACTQDLFSVAGINPDSVSVYISPEE
jgi:hypothetical protein